MEKLTVERRGDWGVIEATRECVSASHDAQHRGC